MLIKIYDCALLICFLNMRFTCVYVRDRFRTMVNVLGDALATGIMAHICRKDFVKEGEEVGKSL